jgi:hypothetical protein
MKTLNPSIVEQLRLTQAADLPTERTLSVVGAAIGLLTFIFVGLLPSLLLGGMAAAQLAVGLLGVEGSAGHGLDALMVLGVVTAATVGATFFAFLGAAAGSALGELVAARVTDKLLDPPSDG